MSAEIVIYIPDDALDAMVERMRASLWATWGEGRRTTDWPKREELQLALLAALSMGER